MKRMHQQSVLLRGRRKCGEIHLRSNVLFSGSFVGIGAYGVLTKRCECSATPASKLFLAGVSVVDGDEHSTMDGGRHPRHGFLCDQRNLDSFIGFGMHAVTVEE